MLSLVPSLVPCFCSHLSICRGEDVLPPMQGCSTGAEMLSILAATAAQGGQGFWKPVELATRQSANKVSINMFWQRTCRLATQGEGRVALGNSGQVLPARGQWQNWLGIPYQSGSPHSLFQVHILNEYNGNLLLFIILKYLLHSQTAFCRMLAQGSPVLEKSWSPCGGHWPLTLSCCCGVPTWGHKRRGS